MEPGTRTIDPHTSTTSGSNGARIAFACGGTAGDVNLAFAIAEALPAGVESLFLGGTVGLEARLAARRGHRLLTTRSAPFARRGLAGKVRAVAATATGMFDARRILRDEGVDLVVGCGGYASVPAVLAAWSLGAPVVLFEANATLGAANRVLERFAAHVLLGFGCAGDTVAVPSTVTGVPVRAEILAVTAHAPGDAFHVLVCGGSLGSPFLDARVPSLLARVASAGRTIVIRHIGDAMHAGREYARLGLDATVVPFVDDMAAEYAGANLAIVSGGATMLAELAAVGLPAIVVPLGTAARDHQTANARAFAATTGGLWCRESEWDEAALAARVAELAESGSAWTDASAGVRRHARADAAAAAARACLAVLRPASARAAASRAT